MRRACCEPRWNWIFTQRSGPNFRRRSRGVSDGIRSSTRRSAITRMESARRRRRCPRAGRSGWCGCAMTTRAGRRLVSGAARSRVCEARGAEGEGRGVCGESAAAQARARVANRGADRIGVGRGIAEGAGRGVGHLPRAGRRRRGGLICDARMRSACACGMGRHDGFSPCKSVRTIRKTRDTGCGDCPDPKDMADENLFCVSAYLDAVGN